MTHLKERALDGKCIRNQKNKRSKTRSNSFMSNGAVPMWLLPNIKVGLFGEAKNYGKNKLSKHLNKTNFYNYLLVKRCLTPVCILINHSQCIQPSKHKLTEVQSL
ncbi:hypothetical protein ATANTOWER_011849 [Ataeniobius toweri]|uniref:Uncharacterized protein n=1 Tax=Ataeniobius toweri TaxID=208326 RepID=A0ABU7BS96_9TELE|nr:hypothetical protein [Ataeniobius toweri]